MFKNGRPVLDDDGWWEVGCLTAAFTAFSNFIASMAGRASLLDAAVWKETSMNFERIDFERNMDVCVRFRRDSFQASYPNSDEWMEHWDEPDYCNWLIEHAKRFPDGVLHLIDNGDIIGQLEFSYGGTNGHVNLFYLRQDVRGAGYGALLQRHVNDVLRSKGCRTATLRVSPKNGRATRFYTKHGWTDCGPDQKYPQVHVYQINLLNDSL